MASSTFKVGDRVRYAGTSSVWQGSEAVITGVSPDCIVVNITKMGPALLRGACRLDKLTYLGFSPRQLKKRDDLLDI